SNQIRQLKMDQLRAGGGCPTCRREDFPWLESRRGSQSAVLCGRNSVQLSSPGGEQISLELLADKLAALGEITRNKFLLRCAIGNYLLTIFPDGRAIIGGTSDIAEARTVYAKYVGN